MYNILYIIFMNTIAVSQLRADLPNLIKLVGDNLERFVVTVSGKPKAVLMSMEELESIEETANVMATVDMVALEKGIAEAKKELGVPLDEL